MRAQFTTDQLNALQHSGKIRGFKIFARGQEIAQTDTGAGLPGEAKYKNQKPTIDGYKFDSKKEGSRYLQLKMMQRAGLIKNLCFKAQGPEGKAAVTFLLIAKNGKERKCEYWADFTYQVVKTEAYVVEDVKGNATRKLSTYIMKRKLMLEKFGITISEQ